jgi:hypothetical protein
MNKMNYFKLYEAFSVSFEKNPYQSFDKLTDSQLREIAAWGLLGEYDTSACWDDAMDAAKAQGDSSRYKDFIEIAIDAAVSDFKTFLSSPYPVNLKGFPEVATLYRMVVLDNESELNRDNLGVSWFANPEIIKSGTYTPFFDMLDHLKKSNRGGRKLFTLTASVAQSEINIPATLWQRSTQWSENEVVLKKDAKINLIKIEDISK